MFCFRNGEVRKWQATCRAFRSPRQGKCFPLIPFAEVQKTLEEKIIEKKTVKRNRPITYSFRVSERERRIIDEKVKTSGLSRTDFLIRALTDKPVVVFERSGEMLQELKRQGNNLNQAVRNCYFYPDEKEQVLSAAAECKSAYRALLSVIGGN